MIVENMQGFAVKWGFMSQIFESVKVLNFRIMLLESLRVAAGPNQPKITQLSCWLTQNPFEKEYATHKIDNIWCVFVGVHRLAKPGKQSRAKEGEEGEE